MTQLSFVGEEYLSHPFHVFRMNIRENNQFDDFVYIFKSLSRKVVDTLR